MKRNIVQIARQELRTFFASPAAFLLLSVFSGVTVFVVFWAAAFFGGDIADVRLPFEWMPLLLIFLVSALTTALWSEERRLGTAEFMLTLPVSTLQLVLGKFLACMGLVSVALLLTLPLPLTVSVFGVLDWGFVIGGYVASLFLAALYVSIGLLVNTKTDNQITSLIGSVLACSALFFIDSSVIASLVPNQWFEILQLLGTGSRFESITRGNLNLRNTYYSFSVVGVFFCLTISSLEKRRWASEQKRKNVFWKTVTALVVVNFFFVNVWFQRTTLTRTNSTHGITSSISDATHDYVTHLRESLLIRGYFSGKTHPLLEPLGRRLRDSIREYEIAAGDKVQVEFVDFREYPELEEEAKTAYGIQPIGFQIAGQRTLQNSYFDILIKYGDRHEVLHFRDLVEVRARNEDEIEFTLRNPEYDITRSIWKLVNGDEQRPCHWVSFGASEIGRPYHFTCTR